MPFSVTSYPEITPALIASAMNVDTETESPALYFVEVAFAVNAYPRKL